MVSQLKPHAYYSNHDDEAPLNLQSNILNQNQDTFLKLTNLNHRVTTSYNRLIF